jgi:hypothetical protein
VIIPVDKVQVGWIKVTVGATGVGGCALIVALVPVEIHPLEFFAVTVYVPVATPVNVTLVW